MKCCFSCKKELDIRERPGRGDTCPFCGSDLKVCLNCRFYNENAYNQCTEPQAERVLEKERANYCEYFEFGESISDEKKEDPLKKLKELFGK
ncbi:MAG: hypothetical protein V3T96_00430 [Thermodesulfobacteriota bacterium]